MSLYRRTQVIKSCNHCLRIFEDGEYYYDNDCGSVFCYNNICGWKDEEDE